MLLIIIASGCSNVAERHDYAESIALRAGMSKQVISTDQFLLTTYSRLDNKNTDLLIVYVEGDGYAFQRKQRLSSDPTPKLPLALELAAKDPNPSILYIARPCQYLSAEQLKNCGPEYWSTHRYSAEVVTAINHVINQFAINYHEVGLVGYSGGGTIATLLAALRQDIKWLVTVAANLDHKAWTDFHKVSPLSGSLNATDVALQIRDIQQRHFVGEKDNIVPVDITNSYMSNYQINSNAKVLIKPGFNHQCCWVRDWVKILCHDGQISAYCR